MRKRTTREVVEDHLRRRAAGDIDGDIRANYHPDVIVLHPDGELRGHDGVRRLARLLCRYENDGSFRCHRLISAEDLAIAEWSGLGGRTDTLTLEGMESFIVRDGLIVAQTVHFSSTFLAAA
jgi:SnoaL-like protein